MPYSCKSYVHGTIGESAVCHRGSRRHQSGSRLLPSDAEVFLASLKTHPRTGTANRVSPEYGGEKILCKFAKSAKPWGQVVREKRGMIAVAPQESERSARG